MIIKSMKLASLVLPIFYAAPQNIYASEDIEDKWDNKDGWENRELHQQLDSALPKFNTVSGLGEELKQFYESLYPISEPRSAQMIFESNKQEMMSNISFVIHHGHPLYTQSLESVVSKLNDRMSEAWRSFYEKNPDPSGKDWALKEGQRYRFDGTPVPRLTIPQTGK